MYKKAALAAIEKITSHGSFLYTDTANELAALYRNSGQFEKAMDIISEYMRRAEEDGNTDTDGYVKNALIQADILRKQNKEKDAIKILEHIVFDCSNKHDDYVKCLLMLVHLYLQYGYGKSLYGVYNEFVKVKPGNSFDDMLDMSEDF
jgi:tetratricopeptide (TPR) repeat protein